MLHCGYPEAAAWLEMLLVPEILVQTNPVGKKTPNFNRHSLAATQPSEKVQLALIANRPLAFQ